MKVVYAVLFLATVLGLLAILASDWHMVTRALLAFSAAALFIATFLGIRSGIKMSEERK
jgi:hypothetical protein